MNQEQDTPDAVPDGAVNKRAVPEWRGKTPNEMPPPRVRLRIFQAHGGKCYRSGRKIRPGDKWALDHILAIINGGANAEHNLAPILEDAHKEKTAEDLKIKSKTYRIAAKHNGTWPASKAKIKGRGFEKTRPSKASQTGGEPREDAQRRATNNPSRTTP
jgi:5-methylcytosine-specific restriction protein A